MIKLRENKGILLVSTFLVATVITILSGAYVTSSLVQNQSVQRERAGLQSFYAAERGIEYAFIESQNNNWSWTTHQAETDTNNDGDADPNELLARQAGIPTPTLALAGASINNTDPDCLSCYEITIPSGQTVQVKAYQDPDRADETIVLSRNTTQGISRILKFRITRRSLFRYFFFYPVNKTFAGMRFDGRGVGGIYVFGNIGLQNTTFTDITELSTNRNGRIFLNNWLYTRPDVLDDSYGGRNGRTPLPQLAPPNNGPPNIFTPGTPYPWDNANWPSQTFPPNDWRAVNSHFAPTAGNIVLGAGPAITLPQTLDREWVWNKYGRTAPLSETTQNVQFFSSTGLAPQSYWDSLELTYGASFFDPAFWNNKTYAWPGQENVNYLDTAQQPVEWRAWLGSQTYLDDEGESRPLDGVINERGTGGYDLAPVNIEANFRALARERGLYIGPDDAGQEEIRLNGRPINSLAELPGEWITDNNQFFNTVRPWRDSNRNMAVDPGELQEENVLRLDISQTLAEDVERPQNGIIFVASRNIMLVNAEELPGNLTIVSPFNVYIRGNYNTEEWQPSAVITNSLVYFLSDAFNNGPEDLPATIVPRGYPDELNYITISNFTNTSPGREGRLQLLEIQIENFFGLSNDFEISNSGSEPANLSELRSRIRSQYTTEYSSYMPNIARADVGTTTTYNLAVASPFDPFAPSDGGGYQLEQWPGGFASGPQINIQGAFLQLSGSWSNDILGNPIRDVPWPYRGQRVVPASGRYDPSFWTGNPSAGIGKTPSLEYEDRFENPQQRPPGDFFAGSQALWEEATDFNRHTT